LLQPEIVLKMFHIISDFLSIMSPQYGNKCHYCRYENKVFKYKFTNMIKLGIYVIVFNCVQFVHLLHSCNSAQISGHVISVGCCKCWSNVDIAV